MKKIGIGLVIVLLVVGAYLGRHQIKILLTGPQPTLPVPTASVKISPTQAPVPADNIYKSATDSKLGTYLTDFQGMALYTFDNDTKGTSNCYETCEKNWPYYTSGATAQKTFPPNISVITRKDGKQQFAWNGMPLYYYAKDAKAGDVMGDGVGGVWHIVKP